MVDQLSRERHARQTKGRAEPWRLPSEARILRKATRPVEEYIVPPLNDYRASWALLRQWAGYDAAVAQKEAKIQRLERRGWDCVHALQKTGLDSGFIRLRRAIDKEVNPPSHQGRGLSRGCCARIQRRDEPNPTASHTRRKRLPCNHCVSDPTRCPAPNRGAGRESLMQPQRVSMHPEDGLYAEGRFGPLKAAPAETAAPRDRRR